MKTWDEFLTDVEFLSTVMITAHYITKDFTRDNSEEEGSNGGQPILYMAYGVDDSLGLLENTNWLVLSTQKSWTVKDNDYPRLILTPHWVVLYGVFSEAGPDLMYKVRWEADICKYAFNKERQVCYTKNLRK